MQKRSVTVILAALLTVSLVGVQKIREERKFTNCISAQGQSGTSKTETRADRGADSGFAAENETYTETLVKEEINRTEIKKQAALTFDDGPGPYTEKLLEGLRERKVCATFFLIGESLEGREETVKQMAQDGHLIGSHTDTHVELTKLPLSEALLEIRRTNEKIEAITGSPVEYIRPPYGSWSKELEQEVEMTEVGWTVDPRDWEVKNADTVTTHVLSHVKDGSIILLHDVYETSVEAAFRIVDAMKEEGYEFVTADFLVPD